MLEKLGIGMAGLGILYIIYKYTNSKTQLKPEGKTESEKQFYEYASIKDERDGQWYMSLNDFFTSCGFHSSLQSATFSKIQQLKSMKKQQSQDEVQDPPPRKSNPFLAFFRKLKENTQRRVIPDYQLEDSEKKEMEDIIHFFESIDTNHDGRISLNDYQTFLSLFHSPHVDLQSFFTYADMDRDELLSLNEFKKGISVFLPHLYPLISSEGEREGERKGEGEDNGNHSGNHNENASSNFLFKYFQNKQGTNQSGCHGISFLHFLELMNEIESFILKNNFNNLNPDESGKISVSVLNDYLISQNKLGSLPEHILENLYILASSRFHHDSLSSPSSAPPSSSSVSSPSSPSSPSGPSTALISPSSPSSSSGPSSPVPPPPSSPSPSRSHSGSTSTSKAASSKRGGEVEAKFGIDYEEFKALHSFIKHIEYLENFLQEKSNFPMDKAQFQIKMENYFGEKLSKKEIEWIFQLFANPKTKQLDQYSCQILKNQVNSQMPKQKEEKKMKIWESMVLGGASAILGATTVFPLDKVKTRIQSNPDSGNKIFKTLMDIIKKEGILRSYRGLQAQLIGITPEKAVKLTVNDYLRKRMVKKHENETGKTNVQLSNKEEMLAGIGTGFVQVFVTNPIEVIKIRLQMQSNSIKSPFLVIKELGPFGLYKGFHATILRDVPFNAFYFSSYQAFKKLFSSYKQQPSSSSSFSSSTSPTPTPTPSPSPSPHPLPSPPPSRDLGAGYLLLASCLAGSLAAAIDTPFDYIKTNLQNGKNEYSGIIDCVSSTIKSKGVSALFCGLKARILIISPLFGITMMCYEMLQRYFFPHAEVGLSILDEDVASIRRERLRYIDRQLQLKYTPISPSSIKS